MKIWVRTIGLVMAFAIGTLTSTVHAVDCRADVDGSLSVGFDDLVIVLSAWGTCSGDCPADIATDGVVDFSDLLEVLSAWGPCPVGPKFNAIQIAGTPLRGEPHFEFLEVFQEGSGVTVALDPVRFGKTGQPFLLWITAPRSEREWDMDPVLQDVRGVPQGEVFTGTSIAGNQLDVHDSAFLAAGSGLEFARGYDVVFDFDLDGLLSDGDYIDGYGDEAGFYVGGDPSLPGPLATTSVDYSGGVMLDQRAYAPSDLTGLGPRPIVFIAHGNGQTYTCFDDLATHLASWGVVVVTHDTDTAPGVETAATTTILNTDYFLGHLDTIAGGVFDGVVDTSRITWIGHSRGAEGIIRAYDRIFDGEDVPVHFTSEDIALLAPIAPTNFLGAAGDPHDVPFHMTYGAADGDVSGAPNCPNLRCQAFQVYERAMGLRALTYIHGADHNDFTACGVNDFEGPLTTQIGQAESKRASRAAHRSVMAAVLDDHPAARAYLYRDAARLRAPSLDPETRIVREYHADPAGRRVIDDFQTNAATTSSSSGGAVSFTVNNLVEDELADANSEFGWDPSDPMNGMTRSGTGGDARGIVFDFDADAELAFSILAPQRDVRDFEFLSLRACQGTRHPATDDLGGFLHFSIMLEDGAGRVASIRTASYPGGVGDLYPRSGNGKGIGWQNEFTTVRIRVTDFLLVNPFLDLADLAFVRLQFGPGHGAALGRVGLDDLEFVRP